MVDWELWRNVGLGIDVASGLFFLAFGLFVWLKRPRTKAGQAAGIMSLGFAIFATLPNAVIMATGIENEVLSTWAVVHAVFFVAGLLLVMGGAASLVRILHGGWPAGAINALLVLAVIAALGAAWGRFESWSDPRGPAWFAASSVFVAPMPAFVLWWAAAALARAGHDLAAWALLPFATTWIWMRVGEFAGTQFLTIALIATAGFGLTLWSLARTPRRLPLVTWSVAWAGAAFAWGYIFQGHYPDDLGIMGFTRILAVFLLGYAVVRYRAFDIDIRLRFTIRQSTIAAVFIAVFVGVQTFVSEFFTDTAGLVGGAVAAAALVFALNPLQRAAERVAAKAMPHARPLDDRSSDERAQMYEALVREAWSDGVVSAKEMRVLDVARERLGLSLESAHEIDARVRG